MKLEPLITYWRGQFADEERRYAWLTVIPVMQLRAGVGAANGVVLWFSQKSQHV